MHNEAVDITMVQISSSCVEWWSPFVCSLRFYLFHAFFCIVQFLFEKYINKAVDSTLSQISSSCVEWWSPSVCSLISDLFHKVF